MGALFLDLGAWCVQLAKIQENASFHVYVCYSSVKFFFSQKADHIVEQNQVNSTSLLLITTALTISPPMRDYDRDTKREKRNEESRMCV